jgi:hypothetical protein
MKSFQDESISYHSYILNRGISKKGVHILNLIDLYQV